jgi:hypothetical protein
VRLSRRQSPHRPLRKTPAPPLQPSQSGVVLMIKQAWWLVVAGALVVGGCAHAERTAAAASLPTSVVGPAPAQNVVSYPEGRYELRGDGASMPFHWLWIPAGKIPR